MSARPPVSVIVPFAGSDAQLSGLLDTLATLELRDGDEVIVADNRPEAAEPESQPRHPAIQLRRASGVCSPGFARNRAATLATGEWLVLIDADTEPSPTLLDAYFTPPPAPGTAVLAGAIGDRAGGSSVAARHSAGREQMSQHATLGRGRWSYAQSANCAVRRDAFVAAGGFDEDARAGEDADLCFRLRAEGWELEPRPDAAVVHRSRATLPALLQQLARHGSGAAWLERRYPGSFPAPGPRSLAARLGRCAGRAVIAALRGRREAALTALLELAEAAAFESGRHRSNRARRPTGN
jgi:GT2 family glycosyltransferase